MPKTEQAEGPQLATAADILGLNHTSDEEEEETPEATEEPEEESSEIADELDEESEETEEEEETTFKLDERVLDALKDHPDLAKRAKEQFKGLAKKEKQLSEREQNLAGLIHYGQRLADANSFEDTIAQIVNEMAQHHGRPAQEIATRLASRLTPSAPVEEEKPSFEVESDYKVFDAAKTAAEKIADAKANQAKEQAKQELLEALGVKPDEFRALMDEVKAKRAQEAENAWVEKHAPAIIAKAEKAEGWKGVTKQMVLQAKKEFPNEEDHVKALKKAFPDRYAKARLAAQSQKKGPEMTPTATSARGKTPAKPLHEWTTADIIAANAP